ncbi:MAG: T9SS type A sorting domain-containing protein [Saprospiraceae bacterium]|nr:T9SS type A sorting domain-containing protein [Saprospiraceae bacterium]
MNPFIRIRQSLRLWIIFRKELQPKFYNSILVTPNPSKDLINIEFDENAVFHIYNQSGQFILSTKDKTIDISNFTSGVYSIYSFTATGQKVSKLFEKIR